MISDILHDAELQVRRLLQQYPQLYNQIRPDVRKWLAHTRQLIKKIEQAQHILNHESFIEAQLQLGRHPSELVLPPPDASAEEYISTLSRSPEWMAEQEEPTSPPELQPSLSPEQPPDAPPLIPATTPVCPKCSHPLSVDTTIEASSQPNYVAIVSLYVCRNCSYHKREQVDLPKEIALQEYNLEQLMQGI